MSKAAAIKKGQWAAKADPVTKALAAATKTVREMTPRQALGLAIRAGIYTNDGELTAPYRVSTAPSRRSKR